MVVGGFMRPPLQGRFSLSWCPNRRIHIYWHAIGFVVVEQCCGWMFEKGHVGEVSFRISLLVEEFGPRG